MKPLVIYHASCADGFGAAFAAWLKLGDEAEYLPAKYNEDVLAKAVVIGRDVYILDFSLPRKDMNFLFANANRIVWLDHHKTAFEMWCGKYERGMFYEEIGNGNTHTLRLNDNKSGAMLAWEYFHPGTEVPMLIRHIDDYDRWQFKIPGTKEFNKALWSHGPWSFEQWQNEFLLAATGRNGLSFGQTSRHSSLIKEGAAILRAHEQNVQSVVKGSARECVIEYQEQLPSGLWVGSPMTWGGLAANCPPHLTSDVGHELANKSGTFGLCWTLKKEGMIAACSLRSNGDYDVSAIAKVFGGGGHKNAAGMEVPIDTLLRWLK